MDLNDMKQRPCDYALCFSDDQKRAPAALI